MIEWQELKLPPINLYNYRNHIEMTKKDNNLDKQALADITVFNKYARFNDAANRRENWKEIVTRNMNMHIEKYPDMRKEIETVYESHVFTKKVLPSMRSLQFGGRPILMAENRIFNCAYAPAESVRFFSELMFLLLGGTGMGYSVQNRHISKLPKVKNPESDMEYKFQVQDSIVGWSDAVKVVCKAFFNAGTLPIFDYRDIREKGSDLVTTGGQAPGPEPLKKCIDQLIVMFRKAVGRKLSSLEVHDMACVIADAVLAGGIRRAAMISLFDRDDELMLKCKSGEWYIDHPYRARSNNSAVLPRGKVSEAEFLKIMKMVEDSGCGEPGVYWTNNEDWGTNPCCEIALRPYQMCNLTEINAGAIKHQKDFNTAAKAASFIGTLQAGYTDFHYLNPKWRIACEKDALLGVSMTGIASGTVTKLDMQWAAECVIEENARVAKLLGINTAARTTCVKPAGTTSLVLGTASGIHAWHAEYYIRRMRAGKDEALAQYMMRVAPQLVEQDSFVPHQVVLSFPQKAPEGSIVRTESMMDLLERVKAVSVNWVAYGHCDGTNQHNVSCTISVKDTEWIEISNWMWTNRAHYNGISVLPYNGGTYVQAPFEDIDEAKYYELLPLLEGIDIGQVFEDSNVVIDLKAELACSGGACEIM
jgi:ribonucleoside-triphosphate reductase